MYCGGMGPTSLLLNVAYSARALVKKTQEPGIKLQKADFFRNEFRRGLKNPPCAFFLIQDGRHHVTPFSKNRGIPQFLTFLVRKKHILVSLLMF